MHENLHKIVNEMHVFIHIFMQIFMSFLWWAIKATNMLQLYTANFLHGFNQFKMAI